MGLEWRQTSTTDQMGRITQYQYDTFGRLTGVVLPIVYDPEGQKYVHPTTQYTYDAYGDVAAIQDSKTRSTQFTFDQFGHQLTRTLPMGQSESTTYDAYGREATHTDFKGQQEVFHYDSLGRQDTKTFYATGSQTPGETVVYHFDTLGREDQATDTINATQRITQYGFDAESRINSITTPEGTVNYVFDPGTGFHTRTYTTNSDITYAPDALQRLKTVTVTKQNGITLGTPLATNYFYTHVGNIDHVTYPNGTETDYAYNTLNRMTSVTNKLGANTLSSYVYTLEADGLRTGVTEQQLEADSTYSTVTKTWSYDALQRLTQEAYTTTISPSTNNYTDQYTFDLVGNHLSKTHTAGGQTLGISYVYNNNDQLGSESGSGSSTYSTTYGYDTNGSLTSVSRTGSGAETDGYGYDLQNRLSTANISRTENGQSVSITVNAYTYNDDGGSRAQSVVTTTIGGGSPTQTTTQFLVDPNNPTGYVQVLEEHVNGSATPNTSYLIGLGLFGQTNSGSVTTYLMPDGHGSTRLVVDASGNITVRYDYDAYGNLLALTAGVTNVPAARFLYNGQQFDLVLLHYYLRARYYAPGTGRFLSMDPFAGSLNAPLTLHRFLYAGDDPVLFSDPSGESFGETMMTIGIIGLLGAMFGFVGTLLYNRAMGLAWHTNLWQNTLLGAGLAIAAYELPFLAYGLGIYGIAQGAAVAIDTWTDPNTTWDQKLAASAFLLLSVYGGYQGIRYGSNQWSRGNLWGNDFWAQLGEAGARIRLWAQSWQDFEPTPLTPEVVGQLAADSGDSVMTVYTRQSTAPLPGKDLHVASNAEVTEGVGGAAARQLFVGKIPKLVWARLMVDNKVQPLQLQMGGARGVEYVIKGDVVDYVLPYFEVTELPPEGQP